MHKKRLFLCVVAHLSPFYAKNFEKPFEAARPREQKKRFPQKDPFGDSKKPPKKPRKRDGSRDGGKLTKAEQLAAAARERLWIEQAKRAAMTLKNQEATGKAAAAAIAALAEAAAAAAADKVDAIAAARAKAATVVATVAGYAGALQNGGRGGPVCRAASMPL